MFRSKGEKRLAFFAHIVMIVITLMALAPFLLMLAGSFTDDGVLIREGYRFIPSKFSLSAYEYLFNEWGQLGRAYLMTIIVTVVGTGTSVMITALASYALSQNNIPGLKLVFILFLIPMLFNGGIVATYINYTNTFDVKNSILAYIVPNYLVSAFNIILVRNYMRSSLPESLTEAAEIDGAGQFCIFFKIVLPLCKPILATTGLLTAVTYWNDWTNGLYYVTDSKLFTLQMLLDRMNKNVQFMASHSDSALVGAGVNLPTISIRMAIAVVGILPIVITYPFFQKYFESGITLGAVKG